MYYPKSNYNKHRPDLYSVYEYNVWHKYIVSLLFIFKDFVLNNWKSEKGVTTIEESSIARLEEDLDMFGYLNKAADICNKTAGIFASPATGWTNGLLLIKQIIDFEEIEIFC